MENQAPNTHHHVHWEGVVEKFGEELIFFSFYVDSTEGVKFFYAHFKSDFWVDAADKGLNKFCIKACKFCVFRENMQISDIKYANFGFLYKKIRFSYIENPKFAYFRGVHMCFLG